MMKMRLLSVGIETVSATIFLIPILLIFKKIFYKNMKQYIFYIVFTLYLSAVYTIVGLPSINYFALDLTVNLIPIITMAGDIKNSILNVILFIPLGISLPFFGAKFMSIKKSALFGLGMSFFIEILQIFTYRTTDVNDLITNTIGTIIGYYIIKGYIEKQHVINSDKSGRHLYILICIVFIVMFSLQPFISSELWNIVLQNYNL